MLGDSKWIWIPNEQASNIQEQHTKLITRNYYLNHAAAGPVVLLNFS